MTSGKKIEARAVVSPLMDKKGVPTKFYITIRVENQKPIECDAQKATALASLIATMPRDLDPVTIKDVLSSDKLPVPLRSGLDIILASAFGDVDYIAMLEGMTKEDREKLRDDAIDDIIFELFFACIDLANKYEDWFKTIRSR